MYLIVCISQYLVRHSSCILRNTCICLQHAILLFQCETLWKGSNRQRNTQNRTSRVKRTRVTVVYVIYVKWRKSDTCHCQWTVKTIIIYWNCYVNRFVSQNKTQNNQLLSHIWQSVLPERLPVAYNQEACLFMTRIVTDFD